MFKLSIDELTRRAYARQDVNYINLEILRILLETIPEFRKRIETIILKGPPGPKYNFYKPPGPVKYSDKPYELGGEYQYPTKHLDQSGKFCVVCQADSRDQCICIKKDDC